MKLYELTDAYQQVLELAENDSESFLDTLKSLEDAIEVKIENTAKLIKTLDGEAEVIKAEEKRLSERRKALENKVTGLKNYLEYELEKLNLDKVKGAILTTSMQNNPPSVEVLNEKKIPKIYFKPQPSKLDKTTLLKDLKEGKEVEGAAIKQTKSLRIR
ncbi:siphovirus Gp157 family protein [Halalkalibacter oceani]|uniref:siphovirus Gp157 family protein n=1 Tax=Halalkalibacter oceani TaxID=1653776 RepID=UPI003397A702